MVKEWLGQRGAGTLYTEKASPWENGCNERFSGKLRDEPLDRRMFHSLAEARALIAR